MMFPHTVTLYYTTENEVTFEQTTRVTILKGVLLDATKAVNVRQSGLEGADAVDLYIPFDVEAIDGNSLLPKVYSKPKEYGAADDKSGLWTLTTDGMFFVKGAVVETGKDFQFINLNYDGVYRITKVDEKDFGSLRHWEVGGA